MAEISDIAAKYCAQFPHEKDRLNQFTNFIASTKGGKQFDRKNFVGHITASALIIDSARCAVLLINHKAIDRWLQPGGHIQSGEAPLGAALREVKEEIGIDELDLTLISPGFGSDDVPLDIDSHHIPANAAKQENQHYHHDFRYLFLYTGRGKLALNEQEAKGYKWVPFAELSRDTTFRPLVEKIRHALSFEFRTKQFYDAIIKLKDRSYPQARAIVVSHIIPDCVYYLKAVNQLWPVVTIVPKPNSIDKPTLELVEREFELTRVTRANINDANNELVRRIRETQGNLILFDIGGYFSEIHQHWPTDVLARVMLIIEDTENGQQKYEKAENLPARVISAARSPLKENEDFLVGQSVLFSADVLMRQAGTLIQYMKCGVFGYGKIGKSIAFHLLQRGVKPLVYDTNPVRRVEAYNRLCSIPPRSEILDTSDAIFCATGNRCLSIEDFRKLKNGCFVFSVTSSDDELDLTYLQGEYQCHEITAEIFKLSNDRHFFFLAHKGNAVNFLHNAIMGTFIHLVRGEMIAATAEPVDQLVENNRVYALDEPTRRTIAEKWIEVFDPEHREISSIEYIL